MGNSESKSNDTPKSPSISISQKQRSRERERDSPQSRAGPNGGQNVPRSHVTKTHTPPTAGLVPSSSTTSTSTSNAQAQATVSASPSSSHSRARSITQTNPRDRTDTSSPSHRSSPMGNIESREPRHRPPSRSATLPPHAADKPVPSPSSHPVTVPQSSQPNGLSEKDVLSQTIGSPYGLPPSEFSRPPRLPLPIDRDPEPTSPIISPEGGTTPTGQNEEADSVPRRSSMLSSTTLDDDDEGTAEIETLGTDPFAQKVTTTMEYRGDYRTVFVTGTFVNWEKKFRMQKTQDSDGRPMFTLTAPLPIGTHHIRFLVDENMIISDQYPTTVDFTNSLVNYLEVAPQAQPAADTQPPVPAEPMPIPGAEVSDMNTETGGSATKSLDIRTRPPETAEEFSSTLEETAVPAPSNSIPEQQHSQPVQIPNQEQQHFQRQQSQTQRTLPKPKLPRPRYTSEIPDILLHLDLYNNPDDERYRRASKAIENLPQPPSLPMFMSKSILNATTPHKDDASVLTMPNHTVLNHLATSSIRNGVLATSVTTRYKRKFLTTIMYKPTSEDG